VRFRIVSVILAVAVAASAPAPASADLIDLQEPLLPPIQLPDVRDLPIVRDIPIVQQLPDVRELPVVRDVTAPAPTPAPAAPSPSPTAVPQSTPAPAPESGSGTAAAAGRTTAAGDSTARGGSTPSARSGASDPASAGTGASGAEPVGTGTRRRIADRRSSDRAARTLPVTHERRERRLRETVRELSGCLGALGSESRRVLVLRTGIGRPAPLSRRAVAERLDATVVQVARSERRGIGELRAAERAGRCGGPAAAVPGETSAPGAAADGAAPAASGGEGGGDVRIGAAGPEGRTGVKEEFKSSPPDSVQTRVLRIAGDAPPLAIVLGLAFVGGFAAVWAVQRRGHVV